MKFVMGILTLCFVLGCSENTKIETSPQTTEAEQVVMIQSVEEFHADLKDMYSNGEYDEIKLKYGKLIRNAMLEMIEKHHKDELENISKRELEIAKDNTIRIGKCTLFIENLKVEAKFIYHDIEYTDFFGWEYTGRLGLSDNVLVVKNVTSVHVDG